MKKNIVVVSNSQDIDLESLDRAIAVLQDLREQYSGDAKISFATNYEGDTNFVVKIHREETDEEYLVRTDREQRTEQLNLIRRRNEYNKLKAEFGE